MEQKENKDDKYDGMVSYQGTGISDEDRIKNLKKIINFFNKKNINIFCSDQFLKFFDLNNMGAEENYNFCLDAQGVLKNILFFINANIESIGMRKELDFAKNNNQKKVLLIKKDFQDLDGVQDFKKLSDKVLIFDNDFSDFDLEKIF